MLCPLMSLTGETVCWYNFLKIFFLNSCLDGYVQKTQTFKFWMNTSHFFLSYTVKEKRAAKSKKCCKILQTLKTLTAMIKKLAGIFNSLVSFRLKKTT